MRKILFRGKRTDNGEWAEGFLTDEKHIGTWLLTIPIIPETVGQYTGLTDRNGKRIFEGDIVKHHTIPMLVKFDEKSASFLVGYTMNGSYYENTLHGHGYLEVIGNIHDNPELLEVRND